MDWTYPYKYQIMIKEILPLHKFYLRLLHYVALHIWYIIPRSIIYNRWSKTWN